MLATSGEALVYRWNTKKSEHFVLYYQNAPIEYTDDILDKAEGYYDSITKELGFTRFEGFWTWDKRTKIYLYDNRKDYMEGTNGSGWSAAHVDVINRDVYAYINMDNFLDIILPHELGHIIFREFIGFKRKLPLWLDEGLVSFLEKRQKVDRLLVAKAIVKTSYFETLNDLGAVKSGFQIMPDIFYAEAASVIEFLVASYGRDKFTRFCQELRDLREDRDWFAAFQETYNFEDLDDMNKKWVEFLKK